MMTIPFRPAPPPPPGANIQTNFPTNHHTTVISHQQPAQQSSTNASHGVRKKNPPPPRPPPPKLVANKSQRREQSVNIFSNLFGTAGRSASTSVKSTIGHQRTTQFTNSHKPEPHDFDATTHNNNASVELISFDSPPSSPQFTRNFGDNERTSSANSFESNKSHSHHSNSSSGFSSASGGGTSAISSLNSGFEDDFFASASGCSSSSSSGGTIAQAVDPYDFIYSNDFPTPSSSGHGGGNSTFYAGPSSTINRKRFPVEFNDSLCNGKSLLAPEPALAVPTIIRPVVAPKPKNSNKQPTGKLALAQWSSQQQSTSVAVVGHQANAVSSDHHEPSYGIALFGFDAGQMGDLSLKVYFCLHFCPHGNLVKTCVLSFNFSAKRQNLFVETSRR